MILEVGPDAVRCPRCSSPLSLAIQGRHTRRWLRQCLNPDGCRTTTVSVERPLDMQPIHDAPVIGPYAGELPLTPAAVIASTVARSLDPWQRAAGEREPGSDD